MKLTLQVLTFVFYATLSASFAEDKAQELREYYHDLPKNIDNIMVIHDPLNWMFKVLDHKSVKALFDEKHFPKEFKKNSPLPNLESWIKDLESQSTWIPEKTVFGFNTTFAKNFDAQVKAMLYGLYFKASQDLGADLESKDVKELRSKLLKNIQRIEIPELHTWARFRTPMTSQMILQLAQIYLTSSKNSLPFALPIEMSDNEIFMKVKLSDYLPSFLIKTSILSFGLGDLPEKEVDHLVAFVQSLSFQLILKQNDSTLWFSLKPIDAPTSTSLKQSPFPDMGRSDSQFDIFSIKWNLENLLQYVVEWDQIISTWKETSIGIAVDQKDKTGSLSNLTNLADKLEPLGTSGYFHYWHDQSSNWEGIAEGFRLVPSLKQYQWPLPQLNHLHSSVMDNSVNLNTQMRINFLDFDQKMLQLKMQDPNLALHPELASWIGFYHKFLSKWMADFLKESPDIFKQGQYYGWDAAKEDSQLTFQKVKQDPLNFENLSIPKIIFLTKVQNSESATAFVHKFSKRLEKDLSQHYLYKKGAPAIFQKSSVKGQEITSIHLANLYSLFDQETRNIKLSGDLQPHFFIWQNHLVFSSSLALTNKLLEKSQHKTVALPEERITQAHALFKNFGEYFDLANQIMTQVDSKHDITILNWFKQMVALIQSVDFKIDQHDQGFSRSFRGEINYANE